MSMRASCIRFVSLLISSSLVLSACYKRKSTQEALKPLEFFYADQLVFDQTSRDTLRSAPDENEASVEGKEVPTSCSSARSGMQECQARLVDIPVPLQSKSLERYFSSQDDIITLGYDVRGYVTDYILFYEQGLERCGWRKISLVSTQLETLLVYDKPERFCVISLRHAKNEGSVSMRIMVYTGIKSENSLYN